MLPSQGNRLNSFQLCSGHPLAFLDDVLAVKMERLEKLLPAVKKEINLPFDAYMYPNNLIATEGVVKILKQNGCSVIRLGIQSSNESYRKETLRRPGHNNEMIKRIADLCHKYRLDFTFDHMYGLPHETADDLIEAVKLYSYCQPSVVNFYTLMYLPNTRILDEAVKSGILGQDDVDRINRGEDPNALDSNISRFVPKNGTINYSIFAFLFILISIFPRNLMIKVSNLNFWTKIRVNVPKIFLIFLKVFSKYISGEGRIYGGVILRTLKYMLLNKFGIVENSSYKTK